MNLSEINWDFNAAGSWPLQIKAVIILLVCSLVAGAGFYALTMDQLAELETLQAKEQELITTFEGKQKKAVNLGDYRAQFADIKKSLVVMMRQMPTKAEVANLLTEISQTAITSGLEPKLFQPEGEVKKEGGFYIELPYSIEMLGKYEELGLFIGGLASLSRIVTVHDIALSVVAAPNTGNTPNNKAEATVMNMKATIKTYTEVTDEESDDHPRKGK
jgi:type IV pilus assembly protein PilO